MAVEKFWPTFEVVLDPCLRWFLFAWGNITFLGSLLAQLGFEIPLGLYLFASTPDISAYVHRLWGWYGDQPLSLDDPPAVFAKGLLHRKDQPLLIDDANRSKHAAANAEALEDALLTHRLPWKNGRDVQHLPLQAIPTIVSSTVSDLACSPSLITLDLPTEQFSPNCFQTSFLPMNGFQEYIMSFANYTSDHILELQSALNEGQAEAWDTTDGTLTEPCVKMLGIFLGIRKFLDDFFAEHDVSSIAPSAEELNCWLMEMLQDTSGKVESTNGLADEFVFVARNMIQHQQINLFPLNRREVQATDSASVYFDEGFLYFTAKALKTICDQMSVSRPMVLRALTAAGLIQGAPTNRTTSQTRVRLYNVYGKPLPMAVYRLRRDAFDQLGDPLILGDEQI